MRKPSSRPFRVASAVAIAAGCGRSLLRDGLPASASDRPLLAFFTIGAAILCLKSLHATLNIFAILRFVFNCFLKPVRGSTQDERLDSFYKGQAEVYDSTRNGLLKGRDTLLKLVASHWKVQTKAQAGMVSPKRKIWVDIGGGTGWNVEKMDEYLPLSSFDAIYLIDLCEPLLEVARQRFKAKGWKNVYCLKQDASIFTLPEWTSGQSDMENSISFVTMSYSLSMIPTYEKTLRRVKTALASDGIFGIVDFYATSNPDPVLTKGTAGTRNLRCGAVSAWFWRKWFAFDHVNLGQERRVAVQSRFETLKCYNGRNRFLLPQLIRLPYYLFLGVKEAPALVMEEGASQKYGLWTPESPFSKAASGRVPVPDFFLEAGDGEAEISNKSLPSWRVPYSEQAVHKQFRTHIYSFTWEDPFCDMDRLGIQDGDRILAITSAGDNILHYAAKTNIQVEAVDMNPCQGHILELKLASIQALEYGDFWAIWGEGKHQNFETLLDTKIAPFLSPPAYAYWKDNVSEFADCFYLRGYSGWAIRLGHVAFALAGVKNDVKRFIQCGSTAEQVRIWKTRLRPIIFCRAMKFILATPFFCWNALGVPKNQLACLLADGSMEDFMSGTFDPVPGYMPLSTGNYHYFLCMNGKYTRSACPFYLSPEGFAALKAKSAAKTRGIKLHTDSILSVLRGLRSNSLTKIIVMDSLDWFDRIAPEQPLPVDSTANDISAATPEKALEDLREELDFEILEMKRVLTQGGHAIWRSAGKYPWYRQRFEKAGFKLQAIDIREDGKAIDRVNMYASLWRAVKQ